MIIVTGASLSPFTASSSMLTSIFAGAAGGASGAAGAGAAAGCAAGMPVFPSWNTPYAVTSWSITIRLSNIIIVCCLSIFSPPRGFVIGARIEYLSFYGLFHMCFSMVSLTSSASSWSRAVVFRYRFELNELFVYSRCMVQVCDVSLFGIFSSGAYIFLILVSFADSCHENVIVSIVFILAILCTNSVNPGGWWWL